MKMLAVVMMITLGCGVEDKSAKDKEPTPEPVEVVENCAGSCHELREMPEEDTTMDLAPDVLKEICLMETI